MLGRALVLLGEPLSSPRLPCHCHQIRGAGGGPHPLPPQFYTHSFLLLFLSGFQEPGRAWKEQRRPSNVSASGQWSPTPEWVRSRGVGDGQMAWRQGQDLPHPSPAPEQLSSGGGGSATMPGVGEGLGWPSVLCDPSMHLAWPVSAMCQDALLTVPVRLPGVDMPAALGTPGWIAKPLGSASQPPQPRCPHPFPCRWQVLSWKSKLPLQTIMRLLQVLVPQVEKICIDK